MHEGPEGIVNPDLQKDGYSLHSEYKHSTEKEHKIKVVAEPNLVAYIHLEKL